MPLKSSLLIPLGRELVVLFAPGADTVAIPKVALCISVPTGSTLVVELECLSVTLWDALSELIRNTKVALCVGIPLKSSFLVPLGRELVVLFAPGADPVASS